MVVVGIAGLVVVAVVVVVVVGGGEACNLYPLRQFPFFLRFMRIYVALSDKTYACLPSAGWALHYTIIKQSFKTICTHTHAHGSQYTTGGSNRNTGFT